MGRPQGTPKQSLRGGWEERGGGCQGSRGLASAEPLGDGGHSAHAQRPRLQASPAAGAPLPAEAPPPAPRPRPQPRGPAPSAEAPPQERAVGRRGHARGRAGAGGGEKAGCARRPARRRREPRRRTERPPRARRNRYAARGPGRVGGRTGGTWRRDAALRRWRARVAGVPGPPRPSSPGNFVPAPPPAPPGGSRILRAAGAERPRALRSAPSSARGPRLAASPCAPRAAPLLGGGHPGPGDGPSGSSAGIPVRSPPASPRPRHPSPRAVGAHGGCLHPPKAFLVHRWEQLDSH